MYQTQQESVSKNPWVYEGLFEWQAYLSFLPLPGNRMPRASSSHCLLRLHLNVSEKRAVVLASELESNRPNIGLALGYESFARAVVECFTEPISRVGRVIWLAHFGDFSLPHSYSESTGREEFCEVHLPWPLLGQSLGGYDCKPLSEDELRYQVSGEVAASLEAVPAVLLRCTG